MKNLYQYIIEGGASGHMKHPYDYTEFTLRNLKGLIYNLFNGRVDDITEKIDGTNIQATMNLQGQVVFIRNKTDLNSPIGGMTIEDMAEKWKSNPKVAETFVRAGETITKVFAEIGPKFFNPSPKKKLVCNCECVIEGKTNVMYYASSQVDFHDIWVYEKDGDEWKNVDVTKDGLDRIEKACEKVDNAQITPKLIISLNNDSKAIAKKYIVLLDKIFKDANCKEQSTIEDWRFARFVDYCKINAQWILDSEEGSKILFDRWFNGLKKVDIKKICKEYYPDYERDVRSIDAKEYKNWVSDVMKPIDDFFLQLGNDIIELCDGILNSGNKDATVQSLKSDIEDAVQTVRSDGDDDANARLTRQLERIEGLSLNSAEGIVFRYYGKLMKLTGSFAPLNQIIGITKFKK